MDAGGFGAAMIERFRRYWRIFGTGLSLFSIGLGGVLIFPLLNIFIPARRTRAVMARRFIRITFRAFVAFIHAFGVLRYEIIGLERLERQGMLILANHPTLIDVLFLMAFVKHADCIVKNGLWRNPFMHAPVRAAGYIRNDYGTGLMEKCIASVRGGGNLIIFPEGTRTPANGSIALKRGAANIAVRAGCNVTPVFIWCTPRFLGKGTKWWQVPAQPVSFKIEVKEDIDIRPFIMAAGSPAMAARNLTAHLQDYFSQESTRYAAA